MKDQDRDLIDCGIDGLKNLGNSIAHPIETVEATAKGLMALAEALVDDPKGLLVGSGLKLIQQRPEDVVCKATEMFAEGFGAGAVISGVKKLGRVAKVADLKSRRVDRKNDYYDEMDDYVHTSEAHSSHALDTMDMKEHIRKHDAMTSKKSSVIGSLPDGMKAVPFIENAPESSEDQTYSFISDANAMPQVETEKKTIKKDKQPKAEQTSKPAEPKSERPDQGQSESSQKMAYTLAQAREGFLNTMTIGTLLDQHDLVRVGAVGYSLDNINKNLLNLGMEIPLWNKVMEAMSFGADFISLAMNGLMIASLFLGPKEDPKTVIMQRYFQAILAELVNIEEAIAHLEVRFDRTDGKIDRLANGVDVLKQWLTVLIKDENHMLAQNIVWVGESVSEDVRQLSKEQQALMSAMHLDELNKYIIFIKNLKEGKILATDAEKLSRLQTALSEMENNWLKKNLCNEYYNGAICPTDSPRQLKYYLSKNSNPQTTLGLMYEYARSLGFKTELNGVNHKWLPSVDIFAHAMRWYYEGKILEAKLAIETLEFDDVETVQMMTDNLVEFAHSIANMRLALFEAISHRYVDAVQGLVKHFKTHLRSAIEKSERFYSLAQALNNRWIKPIDVSNKMNEKFEQAIMAHTGAQELKIPLIFKLAFDAGLLDISAEEKYLYTPASGGLDGTAAHRNHHLAVYYKDPQLDYQ